MELVYKNKKINKIGSIRINELPAIWQVMMEVLNKCLTSKIGGTDQINQAILTIMYGLITGFRIDYGLEIFNLIKRSIITKNGKIISHLPYPRLISIFIYETFAAREMEIPTLDNLWRSNTMKAWSSNHG